ncbi:OTU domain-containing protein 6B [Crotalus adamanteus]|uniref:OTU domain-containing protein 6B n=1 Tax=Crotalus adamanteus TaxID=8729 RepID=A0AAW1BP86_CROAD
MDGRGRGGSAAVAEQEEEAEEEEEEEGGALEQLARRQRKEKRGLQAKIQGMKNTVPKNDKKRRKQLLDDVAKLESELEEKHKEELKKLKETLPEQNKEYLASLNIAKLELESREQSQPARISKAQKRRDKKAVLEKEREERIAEAEIENLTGDLYSQDEFEKYCSDIANTASWGGQLELRALSHILQTPIEVIQMDSPPIIVGEEYNRKPLILVYMRHADAIGLEDSLQMAEGQLLRVLRGGFGTRSVSLARRGLQHPPRGLASLSNLERLNLRDNQLFSLSHEMEVLSRVSRPQDPGLEAHLWAWLSLAYPDCKLCYPECWSKKSLTDPARLFLHCYGLIACSNHHSSLLENL